MIDDIIASKWSRMNEKTTTQNVRLHKNDILRISYFLKENKTVAHFIWKCMLSCCSQNPEKKCSSGEPVKSRKKHKSLTNEEFLISLKMKEKR